MPDATPVPINSINSSVFLYSHRTRFGETTSSHHNRVYYKLHKETVNDAWTPEFTYLDDILLSELEIGFGVIKPIPIKLQLVDSGFVASFVAANISTSGGTWDEATSNLTLLIIDVFELLLSHAPSQLGPGPRRQLSVLRSFITKTEDD